MDVAGRVLRILVVEDDPGRIEKLAEWLPADLRRTIATSAGRAIGVVERDRGRVYAGILLDHDLQHQTASESDRFLSGSDVVDAILKNVSREALVLIHSVNVSQAAVMAARLARAGFDVTQVPMTELTREKLLDWVAEVRSAWEDYQTD